MTSHAAPISEPGAPTARPARRAFNWSFLGVVPFFLFAVVFMLFPIPKAASDRGTDATARPARPVTMRAAIHRPPNGRSEALLAARQTNGHLHRYINPPKVPR